MKILKSYYFIRASLFFSAIFSTTLLFAQKEYGKQMMDSLCAPYYDGRGYVNEGDIRAGDFLVRELTKIGAVQVNDLPMEQFYKFNVNTFPSSMMVSLGDDTLTPGVEYIVDPNSGTAAGSFSVIEVNSETLKKDFGGTVNLKNEPKEQRIYVFNFTDLSDKEKIKEVKAYAYEAMNFFPVVWVTNQKKTWSVGRGQRNYPLIEIDSAAYTFTEMINLNIINNYIPKYESKNIIGCIPGKKKKKYVVFTAHYDHLGRMGSEAYFPGANDNASGCAMLLSLANYYAKNQPEYTAVFCFFSGEEAGLIGSNYFVNHPYLPLKKIKFVINIDIMGSASKGITLVNGAVHEEYFNRFVDINNEKKYLPEIKKRGAAANSDHHFFSEAGVPAFFIYSMGSVTNYHDVFDTPENTPLDNFNEVQQLIVDFVSTL